MPIISTLSPLFTSSSSGDGTTPDFASLNHLAGNVFTVVCEWTYTKDIPLNREPLNKHKLKSRSSEICFDIPSAYREGVGMATIGQCIKVVGTTTKNI